MSAASSLVVMALQDSYPYEGGGGGALALIPLLFGLAIAVFFIAVYWKIFVKAGEPGWAAIIPIYNIIVLLKIAGKPVWWVILFFIPLINLIPVIMVPLALAERFAKSVGFAIGLILIPIVFYPILAFGSARYQA